MCLMVSPSDMVATRAGDGAPQRIVSVRGRTIPVVPPSIGDPRLRVSAVILSVHALGQLWLDFRVSLAQIALTLVTCAAIDVFAGLVRSGALVWPGSGLLTGGGISLVLRVPGVEAGDYWSFDGWYWFVGVAAFGMATKYLLRYRGGHVFNPSNVALVVAFVVFGSSRLEPLDLWWGPFGWAMVAAYAVIVFGGLSVGRLLDLTPMAVAFWVTLASGVGLLAVFGHSITARWSFVPVSGLHFWWIIVTSPEVLIFLFFMITDPRTVPEGRVARVAFATAVGLLCTLLIAPQKTEFNAKVALLAGLVILCALRPWFDGRLPVKGSDDDKIVPYMRRLFTGQPSSVRFRIRRGAMLVTALGLLGATIVVAGLPARPSNASTAPVVEAELEAVDLDHLPALTIDPRVSGFGRNLETEQGARELVEFFAHVLSVEGQSILDGDPDLLAAVDHGDRLTEFEELVADSISTGRRTIPSYTFDALELTVVFPQGAQSSANAGIVAEGTIEWTTYGADDEILERRADPLTVTFTLRPIPGGGWQLTDTIDPDT